MSGSVPLFSTAAKAWAWFGAGLITVVRYKPVPYHSIDCRDQTARDIHLGDEPACAHRRSLLPYQARIILADDYDLAFWHQAPDSLGSFKAIHARHRNVHDRHIRMQALGFIDGIQSILSFATDRPIGPCRQQETQSSPDRLVIIND